ncbi:hypothetical protein ACL02O_18660 [Micromonospora sp. MS34]|uniref:hypothetical protein n=1 Tax=Micromonospora sp. MS34 TaxID=3385971 RepID=UPI0039A3B1C2
MTGPAGRVPTGPGPAADGSGAARGRPAPAGAPPRLALVGANGHGRWHRRAIAPLHAAGRLRLHAGADVLLEKPPVLDLAEHRALAAASAATGRVVQVGFQALGSAALTELTGALAAGRLGPVTGIATVAAWGRPDAYYARAPWVGRRRLDGRPALDGALGRVEVERYRVRAIEIDDTAVLRPGRERGCPGRPALPASTT